jgi:1-acyl-sn-glycerol-3-phosphate acyltransferase
MVISIFCKYRKGFVHGVKALFRSGFQLEENFYNIPKKPCILVCNYPKEKLKLGYIFPFILPVKYCLVVNTHLSYLLDLVYDKENILYKKNNSGNYDILKEQIRNKLKDGYYIFAYIEKNEGTIPYQLGELRSGLFSIAEELQTSIVPIVIDMPNSYNALFGIPRYKILIGDAEKDKGKVRRWMEKNLNIMKINQ